MRRLIVTRIAVRPAYRLWIELADGQSGEVDLAGDLFGPLGTPLLDERRFAEAFVDEYGAVAWPGGFDLAPDWLREQLSESPDRRDTTAGAPPAGEPAPGDQSVDSRSAPVQR